MFSVKIITLQALTGLIGKVPMVRAVSAFIDFFNSSGCEGITFGEMKHFLHEVLDSTLQELSNVKQLDHISSFDKLKGQSKLRSHRCRGNSTK